MNSNIQKKVLLKVGHEMNSSSASQWHCSAAALVSSDRRAGAGGLRRSTDVLESRLADLPCTIVIIVVVYIINIIGESSLHYAEVEKRG